MLMEWIGYCHKPSENQVKLTNDSRSKSWTRDGTVQYPTRQALPVFSASPEPAEKKRLPDVTIHKDLD
jgi:hypothetical protein